MDDAASAQFKEAVTREFAFLASRGFRRLPEEDRDTPVGAAAVFVGNEVAFLVTLDLRDQAVDVRVVRVRAGRLVEVGEGGYSCDLFAHLVRHAGYRGAPSGMGSPGGRAEGSRIERAVAGWANLLKTAGESLLRDEPLPT